MTVIKIIVRYHAHISAQYRTKITNYFELCPQFEACKYSIRSEGKNRRHFSRHAESALVASLCSVTDAESPLTVRINEVCHPASSLELIGLHQFKTRLGVHDRITLLLVFEHLVDDLRTLVHVERKIFSTLKWSVEVYRDLLDGRIILCILDRILDCSVVQRIYYHIDTQVLMATLGDILLKFCECTLSTHLLMI